MSIKNTEHIDCPQCGAHIEVPVWGSINTVIDPDMKEKVRNGEAFRFTCSECGYRGNIAYSFLYHEMDKGLMIHVAADGDVEKAAGIFSDASKVAGDASMDGYTKRVVGSMNQFHEKLMIHDDGLDDRVMELMKVLMAAKMQEDSGEMDIREFLYDTSGGKQGFAVKQGEGDWGFIDFMPDFYETVKEAYREEIERDEDILIDVNWAVRMLDAC